MVRYARIPGIPDRVERSFRCLHDCVMHEDDRHCIINPNPPLEWEIFACPVGTLRGIHARGSQYLFNHFLPVISLSPSL